MQKSMDTMPADTSPSQASQAVLTNFTDYKITANRHNIPTPGEVFGQRAAGQDNFEENPTDSGIEDDVLTNDLQAKGPQDPKEFHSRRATSPAGRSPYAIGDGEIVVKHTPIEINLGLVTSGKSSSAPLRRADREAGEPTALATHVSHEIVRETERKPETGEIVATTFKNGSRRAYQIDDKGKKRAISHDAVMAAYGYADDYQGKKPKEYTGKHEGSFTDESVESASYESRHDQLQTEQSTNFTRESVSEAEKGQENETALSDSGRPADFPEDVWNGLNEDEKNIVRKVAKDEAEKLNDSCPADFPAGVWKTLTLDEKKKVLAVETPPVESSVPSKPRVDTSATANIEATKPREIKTRKILVAKIGAAVLAAAALFGLGTGTQGNHEAAPRAAVVQQSDTAQAPAAIDASPQLAGSVSNADTPLKASPELVVHAGERPWQVLHNAGIPDGDIMHQLDSAAKKSGASYKWHGSGKHQWIEVNGKSDTQSVIQALGSFIQK